MLPEPVLLLLETAYADRASELTATSGGRSHHTVALKIAEQRMVVKAATRPAQRSDLRHEAAMLTQINGSYPAAPQLDRLLESAEWTVEVQRWRPGVNGIACYSWDDSRLSEVYRQLGQTLAALHRLPIANREFSLASRMARVTEQLAKLPLPTSLQATLMAAASHALWQVAEHPTHGDAGLHNVLWADQLSVLLDWEWAGVGHALTDLAWIAWTMRWRKVDERHWHRLLTAYQPTSALEREGRAATLHTLALGQIGFILTRVADNQSAWEEWLRRAEWTQQTMLWNV
jgi:aminoglycoside phosphotransferase (APT) family kinase protein